MVLELFQFGEAVVCLPVNLRWVRDFLNQEKEALNPILLLVQAPK